jgi:hypothetical protein
VHNITKIMNYIWKNRVFLIIWFIIITAIFSFLSFRMPQYKGEMIYEFPEQANYIRDPEMISTYEKREQFKEDIMLLESDVAIQFFLGNSLILKTNYLDVSVYIKGNNSLSFKKKMQRTKLFIDSLYIYSKIKRNDENLNRINTQILEIANLKEPMKNDLKQKQQYEKYAIIEGRMKKYSEYLITKKYSYENLLNNLNNEASIKTSSTNRSILVLVGFIFSVWSGLMIIIIKYFVKSDE